MDIDSDFGPTRGSEVFEHLNELYGKENCCNIITFSNLKAKALLKDICRIFNIPLAVANNITKFVPDIKEFKELLDVPELKKFFNEHQGIYEHCEKLYGAPRQHSQHPAGICVLPFPVTDILPVENAKATIHDMVGLMSQYEKENVELVGGVKLDILKLSNMEALYEQIDLLESEYGIKMTLRDIPLDDKNAWDLICKCDTMGVFQMEGDIGKNIIRQIKPRNIEELSAVNAFVRPGTSGLENYCAAKEDHSLIPKYDPKIDKWLAPTYGAIVYQEEILGMISEMMGVSFGRADIYRRALEKPNKKGNKELFEDFLNNGVANAVKNGINEDGAKRIQKAIIDNAGYLFNKSHSIAYSVISYWCAWVKANYPLIFYLSLINTEPVSKLQNCITEARKHGITILPPDISKSKFKTTIEDKDAMTIRMGLHCIKGVGDKAVDELMAAQPFIDIEDYLNRAGKGAGKGVVMAAIKIGALENLPLKIKKDFIKEEDEKRFKEIKSFKEYATPSSDFREMLEQVTNEQFVYMNRLQQEIWYNAYLENKTLKSVKNYALPQDIIRGQYLDNIDMDEVTVEKDDTIVIPADMLHLVGYTEEDVEKFKSRKKPKGFFLKENELKKLTPVERGFKVAYDNLVRVKYSELNCYLEDMKNFEISFIQHPLENIANIICKIAECSDGKRVRSAGIITNIVKRQTKTGKPFYNIFLQTPSENQRLTVWNNVFIENQNILTVNHIIKITGKVGFGGITVDTIEDAKANYK